MKYFAWNDEKNVLGKRDRGVSFEEIVFHIERGGILGIVEHSNRIKCRGQRMFVIAIENCVWLVPFVESEKRVFLKTAVPSRKAKRYLGEKKK